MSGGAQSSRIKISKKGRRHEQKRWALRADLLAPHWAPPAAPAAPTLARGARQGGRPSADHSANIQ
eukprot:939691-Pyramimonas_sp.AAC.1